MTPSLSRPPQQRPRVMNAEAPELAVDEAQARLPAGLLHDDETIILLLRPSLLYIPLSALGSLLLIALITMAFAWMTTLSWVTWSDTQAFAYGAGLVVLRLGWQTLEWTSRVYVLTDRRVIRRMGVLRVAVFETQLRNIQHTSVFMRLRERVFGLGSIGFATAGSDVFEAFWVMIARPFEVNRTVVEAIERYGKHSH